MVMWHDAMGVFRYALVVQFEEFFDAQFYELTIIHSDRIKNLFLYHKDHNKTWRVMRAG